MGVNIIFAFLWCCCQLSNSQIIHVYRDRLHSGAETEVNVTGCSNLPENLAGMVSSTDTRSNCARFYDGKDCSGNSILLMAQTPSHWDLSNWDFDDKAVSVGPCQDECDVNKTEGFPDLDEPIPVQIYSEDDYLGASTELSVEGCTLIPKKFQDNVGSVKTFGKCVQLYNNVNCTYGEEWGDSIQLRRGTPLHNNMFVWGLISAKSISHCTYQCNNSMHEYYSNLNWEKAPLSTNEVILFDNNENNTGRNIQVDGCVNIENIFEGSVVSVIVSDDFCITLYQRSGCKGKSVHVIGYASDLPKRTHVDALRSLEPCSTLVKILAGLKSSKLSDLIGMGSNDRRARITENRLRKLLTLGDTGNSQTITVYSEEDHEGKRAKISITNCSNLPTELVYEVSSANTEGNCARFYDERDCSGNSILVMARSPSHGDLSAWDFDDKAVSVGPCQDKCEEGLSENFQNPDEQITVEIHSLKGFKGTSAQLNVEGCTLLPARFQGHVQSVKTFGKCIQLYNNVNCTSSGGGADSIELRQGTPLHDDIPAWGFETAKAISQCNYQCNTSAHEFYSNVNSENFRLMPNQQIIYVYSDDDFEGTLAEVDVSKCSNLPDELARAVSSTKTRDICATFYDDKNCFGNSILVTPHSAAHNDFSMWDFDDKAVSVGPCLNICNVTTADEDLEETTVEIFSSQHFRGAYMELKIEGCTLLPTRFQDNVHSLKTNGNCIQIYNNENCTRSGPGVRTFELRPPLPKEIFTWSFNTAKAISKCTYQCDKTMHEFYSNLNWEKSRLMPNEVILFNNRNYTGRRIRFEVLTCVDITSGWEGDTVSIKTSNASCITLYDQPGCKGNSLDVEGVNPDLSQSSFNDVTRSLKPCFLIISNISQPPDGIIDRDEPKQGGAGGPMPSSPPMSPITIAIVGISILLGITLPTFLAMWQFCKRYKRMKGLIDKLSEKEIREFLGGMELEGPGANTSDTDGEYTADVLAQNRPYNAAYEIPRANINFDQRLPLGVGQFGVVYKGSVELQSVSDSECTSQSQDETIQVAVKTTKSGSSIQCLRSLLKEVKVMLYVGTYKHIVQIIGCCTENLRQGQILVLIEFCSGGSLERFLRKNRDRYQNFVTNGRLDIDRWNNEADKNSSFRNTDAGEEGIVESFNISHILCWCLEIASGMEYLTSKKVIHGDLAARNILLDENLQTKISDFGLSRQLYSYSEYVKKKREPLPWRWLAIESLKDHKFSSQSDVWGFGVLCWEIFSLGEKPYPGVNWDDKFLQNLQDGLRLVEPKYAVHECYNLMTKCWDEKPSKRPNFLEIREELHELFSYFNRPPNQSDSSYIQIEVEQEKLSS